MLPLLLIAQSAFSAEPIKVLPPHMQQGDVVTSWGVIPKSIAWGLCMSPEVKVVRVEATRAFPKKFLNQSGVHVRTVIHSELRVDVENNIKGNDTLSTLFVEGGEYNNTWYPTSNSAPQPVVGERYVVAYHRLERTPGFRSSWAIGTPIIHGTITLGPSIELPDDKELGKRLEEECANIRF